MKAAWLAIALVVPAAAHADDQDRDYCPARPGLGTPACTMAPGTVSVETSLADWTLDTQGGDRTDTVSIGDTSVRIGISDDRRFATLPLGTKMAIPRQPERRVSMIKSSSRVCWSATRIGP